MNDMAALNRSAAQELPTFQLSFALIGDDSERQTGWRAAMIKFHPDVSSHRMHSVTASLMET